MFDKSPPTVISIRRQARITHAVVEPWIPVLLECAPRPSLVCVESGAIVVISIAS